MIRYCLTHHAVLLQYKTQPFETFATSSRDSIVFHVFFSNTPHAANGLEGLHWRLTLSISKSDADSWKVGCFCLSIENPIFQSTLTGSFPGMRTPCVPPLLRRPQIIAFAAKRSPRQVLQGFDKFWIMDISWIYPSTHPVAVANTGAWRFPTKNVIIIVVVTVAGWRVRSKICHGPCTCGD